MAHSSLGNRYLLWLFWVAPLTAILLLIITFRLGQSSEEFVDHNFEVFQGGRYILKTNLLVQRGWNRGIEAIHKGDGEALETAAVMVESGVGFLLPLNRWGVAKTAGTEGLIHKLSDGFERIREEYLEKNQPVPEEEIERLREVHAGIFAALAEADADHFGFLNRESNELKAESRLSFSALLMLGVMIFILFEIVRRVTNKRVRAEQELLKAHDLLEVRVEERTRELADANEELGKEVAERIEAQKQRSEVERQMLHAQKLESLGVMAGGIAHDFNNLMQGILGHAELITYDFKPDAGQRKHVEAIETSALRAADLAKQMLAYSGRGQFKKTYIDLNSLGLEMTNLLKTVISKKVSVVFETQEELPPILADQSQVGQVFMNLITNGSEAIGDMPGMILVKTGITEISEGDTGNYFPPEDVASGSYVYLSVTDDGCGMNEEVSQKIFDPFFTTKFTGRGLGMAAVLGIMRGHSGVLQVDSRVGEGTEIKLFFPVAKYYKASSPTPVQTEGEEPVAVEGAAVLLIEDEKDVADIAMEFLSEQGYRVYVARNGLEGVELFRTKGDKIDAVVLDATMPQMGGAETLKHIRSISGDVPVLMCSGYSEQQFQVESRPQQYDGFLAKPYRPSELLRSLNALVASVRS